MECGHHILMELLSVVQGFPEHFFDSGSVGAIRATAAEDIFHAIDLRLVGRQADDERSPIQGLNTFVGNFGTFLPGQGRFLAVGRACPKQKHDKAEKKIK